MRGGALPPLQGRVREGSSSRALFYVLIGVACLLGLSLLTYNFDLVTRHSSHPSDSVRPAMDQGESEGSKVVPPKKEVTSEIEKTEKELFETDVKENAEESPSNKEDGAGMDSAPQDVRKSESESGEQKSQDKGEGGNQGSSSTNQVGKAEMESAVVDTQTGENESEEAKTSPDADVSSEQLKHTVSNKSLNKDELDRIKAVVNAIPTKVPRIQHTYRRAQAPSSNLAYEYAGLTNDENRWDCSMHSGYRFYGDYREAEKGGRIPYTSFRKEQHMNPCPGVSVMGEKKFACDMSKEGSPFAKKCFQLPGDYDAFSSFASSLDRDPGWYIKAIGDEHNNNKVAKSWREVTRNTRGTVQQNIDNPLLLDGRKSDLRLWASIASLEPLEVYVYYDTLLRTSRKPFTRGASHIDDYCMQQTAAINSCEGSIIDKGLPEMFRHMGEKKAMLAWKNLKQLVRESVKRTFSHILEQTKQKLPSVNSCFHFFGFDVVLDDDMNAYLMEVNHLPDMNYNYLYLRPNIEMKLRQAMRDLTDLFGYAGRNRETYIDHVRSIYHDSCVAAGVVCTDEMSERLMTVADRHFALGNDSLWDSVYSNEDIIQNHIKAFGVDSEKGGNERKSGEDYIKVLSEFLQRLAPRPPIMDRTKRVVAHGVLSYNEYLSSVFSKGRYNEKKVKDEVLRAAQSGSMPLPDFQSTVDEIANRFKE
uniref:Tubulin tyrosine ligase n=1 Tax=Palpitomonas bilix TaxID=652834 RepID=A0A7S3CY34_9EUKA|mmetsp:Transcript_11624/g.31237  ORF Transcript_11624/g.31237 Transcript_11624/m.31237 type:complete len:701 (+) Transcript_11624:251-2353(+)